MEIQSDPTTAHNTVPCMQYEISNQTAAAAAPATIITTTKSQRTIVMITNGFGRVENKSNRFTTKTIRISKSSYIML